MSDEPKTSGPPQEEPSYVPASPVKRIIAWVGVVYMILIVLLNVYPFFMGGEYLTGVAPLMVCPGTAGLAVIALWQFRRPEAPLVKKAGMAVLAAVCAAVFVMGLIDGIPPLIAGLGGGA